MTLSITTHYLECHYAGCQYADCHDLLIANAVCYYAGCRYAECRGAKMIVWDNLLPSSKSIHGDQKGDHWPNAVKLFTAVIYKQL
jgi:hypothetical protein